MRSGNAIEPVAAQAVYDPAELDAEASIESLSEEEAEALSTSAQLIKAANPRRVFFSHDSRVWPA